MVSYHFGQKFVLEMCSLEVSPLILRIRATILGDSQKKITGKSTEASAFVFIYSCNIHDDLKSLVNQIEFRVHILEVNKVNVRTMRTYTW